MERNLDLTSGKPIKKILYFTLPLLIGNIFQQLYSMVDTIIVGRTVSLQALAAVGATGGISFLVIGFVQGVTSGFSVITAQFHGARDEEGVKRSVAMSFLLSIGVTALVTPVAVATTMPLLKLMQTPADIIQDSYDYIVVIYYGIFSTVFYNIVSNLIRSIGDSRTPLYFLILASVLNIGLDFLFILQFKMGVAGAGWATVLSQTLSGIACLIFALKKYKILRVSKRHFAWSWKFAWRHLRVGLPMALQFSITAVGVMVIQTVLNGFGSDTVASYTAASKIDMLATQGLFSLGTAMATYAAQNYGAGKFDRIKKGVNGGLITVIVMSAASLAFILLLQDPLIRLFADDDFAKVADQAHRYLYINAGCYFLLGLVFLYRNTVQGMGYSGLTMFAGVAELVMRVVAAFVFAKLWGYTGVCVANPVAWLGADVFLVIAYYLLMRRRKEADRSPLDSPTHRGFPDSVKSKARDSVPASEHRVEKCSVDTKQQ